MGSGGIGKSTVFCTRSVGRCRTSGWNGGTSGKRSACSANRPSSDSVKKGSFVFENTPLPKVLAELSRYYGVKLVADRTDKRLTANFDAHSLDEIIEIIEKVLKVHIKKQV